MPEAEVRFSSTEEYELLRAIRDRHGVMWRGMLLQGARELERYDRQCALLQPSPVSRDAPVARQSFLVTDPSATSEEGTRWQAPSHAQVDEEGRSSTPGTGPGRYTQSTPPHQSTETEKDGGPDSRESSNRVPEGFDSGEDVGDIHVQEDVNR